MNTRQLQYAITLAQVRNFSQVAQMLNISQPALSKQIIGLENDLGIKLFDRNTNPLRLTPAGEYFIQEAKTLLYREDQLLRTMERYRSGTEGKLTIGISPFRCLYQIPPIVKQLKEKFPGVQVCLHEITSDQLRKDAAEGKYDFAIVNLPVDETLLEVIPLQPDTLVLAVPQTMAQRLPDTQALRLEACGQLPFIVVGKNQEMRQLFDRLCQAAAFQPVIAAETVGLASAWALVDAGIGAAVLPKEFVQNQHFSKNLRLYGIKNMAAPRQPAIVYRKGQYLSPYAEYAIAQMTAPEKGGACE